MILPIKFVCAFILMILDHSTDKKNNNHLFFLSFYLFFFFSLHRPEIQHFMEKIKREKEAKMNNQENDNRPFVLKYVSNAIRMKIITIVFVCLVEIHITSSRDFSSTKCLYRSWSYRWWTIEIL